MVSGRQRNWDTDDGSQENGTSDVVYNVVTENKRLLVLEGSDGWVFLLLEYDLYFIN